MPDNTRKKLDINDAKAIYENAMTITSSIISDFQAMKALVAKADDMDHKQFMEQLSVLNSRITNGQNQFQKIYPKLASLNTELFIDAQKNNNKEQYQAVEKLVENTKNLNDLTERAKVFTKDMYMQGKVRSTANDLFLKNGEHYHVALDKISTRELPRGSKVEVEKQIKKLLVTQQTQDLNKLNGMTPLDATVESTAPKPSRRR